MSMKLLYLSNGVMNKADSVLISVKQLGWEDLVFFMIKFLKMLAKKLMCLQKEMPAKSGDDIRYDFIILLQTTIK